MAFTVWTMKDSSAEGYKAGLLRAAAMADEMAGKWWEHPPAKSALEDLAARLRAEAGRAS